MKNETQASILSLYEALSGLLNTEPGQSEARVKAIAKAESVFLDIQKDPRWQHFLNSPMTPEHLSDVADNAKRYAYIRGCAHGDGYPDNVFESLTGGPESLDDAVDRALENCQSTISPSS